MPAGIPDVPVPPLLAALERVPLPANTARLHLLLGDFRIRNYQGPVATVVLHYRDGGSYRHVLAFPHPHSRRLHYAEPLAQIDAAAAAGANLAWVGRAYDTARYQFPTVPLYRTPLVVEKAMYRGHFAAGGVTLATRLPDPPP